MQRKNAQVDDRDDAPNINAAQIEEMGRSVLASMRSFRELLEARAAALEEHRQKLVEYHDELTAEREEFDRSEAELCADYERRGTELGEREEACGQREGHIQAELQQCDAKSSALAEQQEEHRIRSEKFEADLSDLQARETQSGELERRLADLQEELAQRTTALQGQDDQLAARARETEEANAALEAVRAESEARQQELTTRSSEIEQQRAGLESDQAALVAQAEELETERGKLVARESECVQRAGALEAKAGELSALQSQLELAQQGWQAKMEELERSRKSLADLQREVEGEVSKVASETSELMPRYGVTEHGVAATGGLPKVGSAKHRGSVERFQKLRRDAKRKAIGAG